MMNDVFVNVNFDVKEIKAIEKGIKASIKNFKGHDKEDLEATVDSLSHVDSATGTDMRFPLSSFVLIEEALESNLTNDECGRAMYYFNKVCKNVQIQF